MVVLEPSNHRLNFPRGLCSNHMSYFRLVAQVTAQMVLKQTVGIRYSPMLAKVLNPGIRQERPRRTAPCRQCLRKFPKHRPHRASVPQRSC